MERKVIVAQALHARPLDQLVRHTRGLEASVRLDHGGKQADGKNVVQLLLLGVPAGAEVTVRVEGPDQERALEGVVSLLGEVELTTAPTEKRRDPKDPGVIQGVAGAPGCAAGPARWLRLMDPGQRVAGSPDQERRRLGAAQRAALDATARLINGDDPFCDIFEAQLSMLQDAAWQDEVGQQIEQGAAAEAAVAQHFATLGAQFAALDGAFAQERHADVADVRDRLLEALQDAPGEQARQQPRPVVLLLDEATPSRMITLDLQRVAAVVSARGGPTSHAAIVARGRGVPLVFAAAELLQGVQDGSWLVVDGGAGLISPTTEQQAAQQVPNDAPGAASGPLLLSGGHGVPWLANLGAPGELDAALRGGCGGCGLLRTELLYQGRQQAPTVEAQAEAYGRVARALAPRPVAVRLFDAGSDKPLAFLPTPAVEPNPALGLRGLRLLRQHPQVLADQLEAIARASEQAGGKVHALVPMVVDPKDLQHVQRLAAGRCPVGAMIETPAAALQAEAVVACADFVSVGTNDLAQYVLAADRQSGAGASPRHVVVLGLIAAVAQAARDAGIPCSVCGEAAADPLLAPLLVGLGARLSLAPASAPAVRRALARWDMRGAQGLARAALELERQTELEALLRRGAPNRSGDSR